MMCPRCGEITHRSHTRGFTEKLIKALTSYKTYRCHECGWRGWFRLGNPMGRRYKMLTIISVLITLLITTLLALYLVEKLSPAVPNAHFEQQTP